MSQNGETIIARNATAAILASRIVEADSETTVITASARLAIGDQFGISGPKIDVAIGERVDVFLSGRTRLVVGGAVTAGDLLGSDATGRGVLAVATNFVIAKALEDAAAANIVIDVMVIDAKL